MKKITKTTLKKWDACEDGYEGFCELFPKGADLKTASIRLIDAGHPDWSSWLWAQCKNDKDYCDQTTATAGWKGTAIAGDEGTAIAGDGGTAIAGDGGYIIIEYWDKKKEKYLRKFGAVGEGELKPDTAYILDENGKFIQKSDETKEKAA
ncbi:MAG: hypothetical protein ACUZ8H_05430 [Candidatus Anammoxibacter sp.]